MRGRGWGVMWGVGGTRAQERACECCTCPLATFPLKRSKMCSFLLKYGHAFPCLLPNAYSHRGLAQNGTKKALSAEAFQDSRKIGSDTNGGNAETSISIVVSECHAYPNFIAKGPSSAELGPFFLAVCLKLKHKGKQGTPREVYVWAARSARVETRRGYTEDALGSTSR